MRPDDATSSHHQRPCPLSQRPARGRAQGDCSRPRSSHSPVPEAKHCPHATHTDTHQSAPWPCDYPTPSGTAPRFVGPRRADACSLGSATRAGRTSSGKGDFIPRRGGTTLLGRRSLRGMRRNVAEIAAGAFTQPHVASSHLLKARDYKHAAPDHAHCQRKCMRRTSADPKLLRADSREQKKRRRGKEDPEQRRGEEIHRLPPGALHKKLRSGGRERSHGWATCDCVGAAGRQTAPRLGDSCSASSWRTSSVIERAQTKGGGDQALREKSGWSAATCGGLAEAAEGCASDAGGSSALAASASAFRSCSSSRASSARRCFRSRSWALVALTCSSAERAALGRISMSC